MNIYLELLISSVSFHGSLLSLGVKMILKINKMIKIKWIGSYLDSFHPQKHTPQASPVQEMVVVVGMERHQPEAGWRGSRLQTARLGARRQPAQPKPWPTRPGDVPLSIHTVQRAVSTQSTFYLCSLSFHHFCRRVRAAICVPAGDTARPARPRHARQV